ncbi:CBS domain-containing protein [Gangjinia marincola]|uniref:CBS domain-containing protein n=2 Tax=Gangjinia marincola TaxID=578463 RepID=A0ABN1MEL5_9FLAO
MGIKSFQGKRAETKIDTSAPIKVSDYMTKKLITFHPDQPVIEVMDALIKHKITGGPVVSEDGELVGIISDADCMKQISESRYFNMPVSSETVSKYMSTNLDTMDINETVFDAATKFHQTSHRRFPVLENGKLCGMISRKDILIAGLKLQGQRWGN